MQASQLLLGILAFAAAPIAAQFENIFANMFKDHRHHQQQAQQQDGSWIENAYDKSVYNFVLSLQAQLLITVCLLAGCDGYLCVDTMSCVSSPVDCPCVFPNSQIKCVLPNKKSYVCISAPADGDPAPRDCAFVEKAYNGLV